MTTGEEIQTNYHQYQRLGENEIRLLEVESGPNEDEVSCKVHHFPINAAAEYVAISYRWGEVSRKIRIHLDGKLSAAVPNAWAALRAQRQIGQRRLVWIDAICINQEDLAERSSQVSMMNKIYASAYEVYIWLGRDELFMSGAFAAIRDTARAGMPVDDTDECNKMWHDPERSGKGPNVTKWIFDYDYWDRIWIIQEIFFARRLSLMSGRLLLPWDAFESFVGKFQPSQDDSLFYHENQSRSSHDDARLVQERSRKVTALVMLRKEKEGWSHQDEDRNSRLGEESGQSIVVPAFSALRVLLANYQNCKCSDPRDKIYGLIPMWNDNSAVPFPVDYAEDVLDLLVTAYEYVLRNEANKVYPEFCGTLQQTLQINPHEHNIQKELSKRLIPSEHHLTFQYRSTQGKLLALPTLEVKLYQISVISTTHVAPTSLYGRDELGDFLEWLSSTTNDQDDHHGNDVRNFFSSVAQFHRHNIDLSMDMPPGIPGPVWASDGSKGQYRVQPEIEYAAGGPRIFVDNTGRLGLGCSGAQQGDLVCVGFNSGQLIQDCMFVCRLDKGVPIILGRAYEWPQLKQPLSETTLNNLEGLHVGSVWLDPLSALSLAMPPLSLIEELHHEPMELPNLWEHLETGYSTSPESSSAGIGTDEYDIDDCYSDVS